MSRAHDRQDLIGTLDREQYIDIVLAGDTDTGRSLTPLAVRGEDLCLFSGVAARDGYELTKVALARTRAGRAVSTDWFGEDQLDEALDELDRQWVEFGGP